MDDLANALHVTTIALDELRQLRAENERLLAVIASDTSMSAVARMREALEWYADPPQWRVPRGSHPNCLPRVLSDDGKRARAALSATG